MKQILYSPPAIIIFTILTVFLIISLRGNLKKVDFSRQNFLSMQRDVTERRTKLEPQKKQLEALQEPLAKEKITRNELLKQKESEYILYIPEIEFKKEGLPPTPTPRPIEEWRKLLGF